MPDFLKLVSPADAWAIFMDNIADPIFFKSNLIFNLVNADGLVQIPPDVTELKAGEVVKVVLLQ